MTEQKTDQPVDQNLLFWFNQPPKLAIPRFKADGIEYWQEPDGTWRNNKPQTGDIWVPLFWRKYEPGEYLKSFGAFMPTVAIPTGKPPAVIIEENPAD
jgi:hypothetical protein